MTPRWWPLLLAASFIGAPALAAADTLRVTRTLETLTEVREAIARHETATGERPESSEALGTVIALYAPRVPRRGALPVDSWGNPLRFAPLPGHGAEFVLYSTGKNASDERGAGDDVVTLATLDRTHYPELERVPEAAIKLLPALTLVAVAPLVWGVLRWAKRSTR